ncbi:ATP-dependent DNA helicase [Paenibacillus koleovorans]|uniref:ATP-dependent DNA helicase n=1 Tax=Paenibacillus koleovorans TaxID=121608 RepID=UPI000FD80FD6|nr:ATP-dependent DNA helicase [Paenibacillus koleovorans]
MTTEPVFEIAVRTLAEYAFRSGSIDAGFRSASSLADGVKAHQKLQLQYGEQDRKEVHLREEIACDGLAFVLEGRCDGLLQHEEGVTIEEIKSTASDITSIEGDGYPVHWAQAYGYAYMYAVANGLPAMRIQLTYVHVESDAKRCFIRVVPMEELEREVMIMLRAYAPFARMLAAHGERRDASIEQLSFPYDTYRPGQRKLAGAVYKSIEESRKLFVQAPTGIGKTISTTFPAVKAMGRGFVQRLFYLTARTITRTAAEDAFARMQANGLMLHAVTITAKDKICFQPEVSCRKEDCPFADGYYDRINGALLDLLSAETLMTRPVIEAYARKHRVCPFELSLDAAYVSEAVICDYNYVFDPRVSLKRWLAEQKRSAALLIDEAHNLVDRGRDMFSAAVRKADFLALQREMKGKHGGVYNAAKAVNDYMIAVRKEGAGESRQRSVPERPDRLNELLEGFVVQAEQALLSMRTEKQLLDLFFSALAFTRIHELYDERFVTFYEMDKSDVQVKLFCLDPSHLLRQMGKGFRSHIYFSATLTPGSYYRDMLGAEEDDYGLAVPSPFSSEQWKIRVHPVSTRYRDREQSKETIASIIRRLVEGRKGNYLVFFPSYAYMESVLAEFVEVAEVAAGGGEPFDTLVQQPEMREEEREQFLSAFSASNSRTLVGFAVLGGIFSEGIDLVGDRLTGVVVVGVGLPQVGLEREEIKRHFDEQGKNGFEYAYVFPGMNKVLQAGGRLIRSEEDHGLLLLIDDRYVQPRYKRLLPDEWLHFRIFRGESWSLADYQTESY